jgi:hypothetical protein
MLDEQQPKRVGWSILVVIVGLILLGFALGFMAVVYG